MRKFFNKRTGCAVLLAALVGLAGCGGPKEPENSTSGQIQQEEGTGTQSQETKGEQLSYLTGLPVSDELYHARPLAVMFNNIEAGCPQAGIAEASIIYEVPVEGRITRLMGIFEDYRNLEKIGSIRSSRDYFVYFALEYDALYAHFGQATPYVGDLLNSDRVDNISGAVPESINRLPIRFTAVVTGRHPIMFI